MHLGFKNLVNQTVFLRDLTTPLPCSIACELLWMSCASTRVVHQLVDQFHKFFVGIGLITTEFRYVLLRSLGEYNRVHGSKRIEPLVHFLAIGESGRFSSAYLLATFIYTTEELLASHFRGVGLLFGDKPAKIFGHTIQHAFIFGQCAQIAQYIRIQLYACHNLILFISVGKITIIFRNRKTNRTNCGTLPRGDVPFLPIIADFELFLPLLARF